jgi:mannan endo-1,4-beta-mannosidase
MKSRLVMLMSLAIAALSVVLAAQRLENTIRLAPPSAVHAHLPQRPHSYLGVFAAGKPSGYPAVDAFADTVGEVPNLAGYFSGWAEPFDTAFADSLRNHGAAVLVQINPTDASMAAIANGTYDEYLRDYADSVKAFGGPVVIGFGPEMNASWSPWGYGHVQPSLFVQAWRHLVTVFRQVGADNVTWLWTVQADQAGTGHISDWWPGADYVTWVGIDGFYSQPNQTFSGIFGLTIAQVRAMTSRPILLAETAVGPKAGQFTKILNLFAGMATSKTLGLVWFNIDQHAGIYHQDWQILPNSTAATAFRGGVAGYLSSLAKG